jgi:hypothetical protein
MPEELLDLAAVLGVLAISTAAVLAAGNEPTLALILAPAGLALIAIAIALDWARHRR